MVIELGICPEGLPSGRVGGIQLRSPSPSGLWSKAGSAGESLLGVRLDSFTDSVGAQNSPFRCARWWPHPAAKGTSAGTPGGVTCWPGKHHDWPANPTAFRPPFSALAGPPTGLTALPGRRNFQNGKGAQKGGFGTGEIQKRAEITNNLTANIDAKSIGVVGALGMMDYGV